MRIVVEPNVLISAAVKPNGVSGRLIELFQEDRFGLILSLKVLEELHAVLSRDRFRRFISMPDVEEFIASLVRRAEFVEDPLDPAQVSPDPGDDYLPALATAAQADFLVSGDPHLTDLDEASVKIRTPRQLLSELGEE